MGECRQISCRRIPNNFCVYSVPTCPPFLKCELCKMTSLQRLEYEKGDKRNSCTVEKPGKHYLSHVTKRNIISDKLCWYHVPLTWGDKMAFHLFDLPLLNPYPQSNFENKRIGKIPIEGCPWNIWTVLLKTVQVVKNNESLGNISVKRSLRKLNE